MDRRGSNEAGRVESWGTPSRGWIGYLERIPYVLGGTLSWAGF